MIVVSPSGKCSLACSPPGTISWSFETNTGEDELYETARANNKDYMDVIFDEPGIFGLWHVNSKKKKVYYI